MSAPTYDEQDVSRPSSNSDYRQAMQVAGNAPDRTWRAPSQFASRLSSIFLSRINVEPSENRIDMLQTSS